MKSEFSAVIQDGGDGWLWAWSPDVPGANGQGRTEDEALEDLSAAIELLLEYRRETARATLQPGARVATVAVG
ncbi:MAG: type II toxin-antitoxin system HicB family antitoxin [Dehalococcoidia bacterium]